MKRRWTLEDDRVNTHPGGPSWCLEEHTATSVMTVARFYVESEGLEVVRALTALESELLSSVTQEEPTR